MKKRIGNDITFSWHIYRKSGEEQVPESFAGKDVEVKLISPLQRPVTIEDVSIATGVVTFTFRGKHQVTLGNYVAVLQENRGEDGMVTLDVVNAVTLVAHSYMEEDGDEGDVIEASSVELESSISAGGGGGFVQQQADWAQTDYTAVDYIKNKPDLNEYTKQVASEISHEQKYTGRHTITGTLHQVIYPNNNYRKTEMQPEWIRVVDARGENVKSIRMHFDDDYNPQIETLDDKVVWQNTATQQIPAATSESNGLMSAEDKKKLDDMKGVSTAADVYYDNTKTGLTASNVQDAIDEMADTNLYETVVLTVGSADSSFNPVGQTITVTLEDGSATQYTVPMSRQITFIVQRGMRYTISGTSTNDYRVLPLSVKAAIPIRYLTMRYIPIATGVFILQKDGNYYLREEYDAKTMAENAVGVLVLTSALIKAGYGIVIAKDIRSYYSISWPSKGNPWGSNISDTSLDGYVVTAKLHGNYPSTDCAINKAFAEVIQMDERTLQGYLGSKGEWTIIVNNQNEINNTLLSISTNTLHANGKLTSTPDGVYGNTFRWKTSTGLINFDQRGLTFPFFYYEL